MVGGGGGGLRRVLSASGLIQNAFVGSIALGRQLITSLLFRPPLKPPPPPPPPLATPLPLRTQPLFTVINFYFGTCSLRSRSLIVHTIIDRDCNTVTGDETQLPTPCIHTCHCLCYGTLRTWALPTEVGLTVMLTPAVK